MTRFPIEVKCDPLNGLSHYTFFVFHLLEFYMLIIFQLVKVWHADHVDFRTRIKTD